MNSAELLPKRLPLRVWLLASLAFVIAYGFMWSVVHVQVDLRPCLVRLPDPLFDVIPRDGRWKLVSHTLYTWLTVALVAGLLIQAVRGDHRGLVRFGVALTIQALLRSATIWLLPICRINVEPGTAPLSHVPMLDLGLFAIPWRVWATNDLVFSGHIGEFLLLYWATYNWPKPVRWLLVAFQIAQVYALLATRGHYTVDIVVALPCAYYADGVALKLIALVAGRGTRASVPAQALSAASPIAQRGFERP